MSSPAPGSNHAQAASRSGRSHQATLPGTRGVGVGADLSGPRPSAWRLAASPPASSALLFQPEPRFRPVARCTYGHRASNTGRAPEPLQISSRGAMLALQLALALALEHAHHPLQRLTSSLCLHDAALRRGLARMIHGKLAAGLSSHSCRTQKHLSAQVSA
jgi:hypothetical protein